MTTESLQLVADIEADDSLPRIGAVSSCNDLLDPLHVISLGAGVQSSAMALMAACGEITPMPDCAIFADTQAEPAAVYEWLNWLEKQLPFPVHRVTHGNLLTDTLSQRPKGKFLRVDIPAFVVSNGKVDGLINRSCTRDYKINPIRKKLREMCGLTGKRSPNAPRVIQWIGISLDEISRMKDSRDAWIKNRWPLIDARQSRNDCLRWMESKGFPRPTKSRCTFCPYHSDNEWRALTKSEFAQCVDLDNRLREAGERVGLKGKLYLHKSGRPLSQVDLSTEEQRGQTNLWHNECEGMCGV